MRLPFVEPLIFLSATSLNCKLTGTARSGTYLRGQTGAETDPGIIGALHNGTGSARDIEPSRVDQQHARVLARAMAEAGIRPSNKHRKVGDYQLGTLLALRLGDISSTRVDDLWVETGPGVSVPSLMRAEVDSAAVTAVAENLAERSELKFAACLRRTDLVSVVASRSLDEANLIRLALGKSDGAAG